jgi:hypothetical protein
LAGGSGAGSSIDGASRPSSLMIFIVAAMIASVVGAVMVTAWVRWVFLTSFVKRFAIVLRPSP